MTKFIFTQEFAEQQDGNEARERERESDKMTVTDGEKRRRRRERAGH